MAADAQSFGRRRFIVGSCTAVALCPWVGGGWPGAMEPERSWVLALGPGDWLGWWNAEPGTRATRALLKKTKCASRPILQQQPKPAYASISMQRELCPVGASGLLT